MSLETATPEAAPVEAPASDPAPKETGTSGTSGTLDGGTVLDAPASDPAGKTEAPAQASDSDWRKQMAGDDEKELARLQRFTKPEDVWKAYREGEQRFSEAGRVRIPGADASDAEKAEFKKLVGVPEKFSDYDFKPELPEGFEFGEEDSALLDDVRKEWHESGSILAHPEVHKAAVEALAKMTEKAQALGYAKAIEQRQNTQKYLKETYGHETDRNIGFATEVINRYFPDLSGKNGGENLLSKTFADGTSLGDYVPFIEGMMRLGRETVDDPLFLEASKSGGDGVQGLESRKKEIMDLRAKGDMKGYAARTDELEQINDALERQRQRR